MDESSVDDPELVEPRLSHCGVNQEIIRNNPHSISVAHCRSEGWIENLATLIL